MSPSEVPSASGATLLTRLADGLIRHHAALLLGGLLLVAAAILPASRLQLNESIETFYADDNPHLRAYLDSRRWFGGDEFVLVAYDDPELLSPSHLRSLRTFGEELSQVPGLRPESTLDLALLLDNVATTTEATVGSGLLVRLALRLFRDKILGFSERILISDDWQTAAVVLRLLPVDESPVPRRETIEQIRAVAAAHDPPAAVAGEPVQIHDTFRYVEQDGRTLGLASSGLLMLTILLMFRSIRWMVLPLLVVQAALVWTRATMVFSGLQLSMVSSILTSLVTIIGIATVTHVTVRFRSLRTTQDRPAALRQTILELGPAIAWTVATTSVGFAALVSSSITPVRSFGLTMAVGTLLVLVAALLLLPGGILLGGMDTDPRRLPSEDRLQALLRQIACWVEQHARVLLAVMIALALFGAWGMTLRTVETDFTKNFREDSSLIKSVSFFEERLGGVGNWEINFPAPRELTPEFLEEVSTTAERLRELRLPSQASITKVVALTDGLDFIPAAVTRVLDPRATLRRVHPEFEDSLYNPEAGRMRIVLRSLERQPADVKLQLIDAAEASVRQTFPEAQATGIHALLAHLIESLLRDQLVSFVLAGIAICTMMSIAFRSVTVGLISLIPNMFPILMVIGGMGWLGVPVSLGTAMITCVSMGLTVDSSIHYLSGYRQAREAGLDHSAALQQTHAGVGRALIFANVALVLGFSVLSLSNFIPLVYFGVLVSAAMFGGLLGNLVLLPLLLKWVHVPLRNGAASGGTGPVAA